MARRSDGGEGNRIIVSAPLRADTVSPWSVATYPRSDPAYAPDPDRVMATSSERLYWRATGALAYRAGGEHPVDEEYLLVNLQELQNPTPEVPRRGRPRKNPNDPKWRNA